MPIEGTTAPEEGAKGVRLGRARGVDWGFAVFEGRGSLGLHIFSLSEYSHPRGGGGHVHFLPGIQTGGPQTTAEASAAEASAAIPKKRAKQRTKATISLPNLYNA